jgi:hypothetical protein
MMPLYATSRHRQAIFPWVIGIWAISAAPTARGAAVVIANRTPERLQLSTVVDGGPVRPILLDPGDSRPLFANASAHVRVRSSNGKDQDISLEPNCAYYVGIREGDSPALRKIGLGEAGRQTWKRVAKPPLETADSGVITVKILVDDDEARPRRVWEPVIRERIDQASAVLDAHCGIRLKVVAIDTWNSDNNETDFEHSLSEFEQEALPAPAMVAIGFSSQYVIATGRVHLGGTRGPLHSHILIKERSQNVLEPERLELLVHELGHFLGATHSPEATSVMRPVVGQGLQRAAGAKNQFDPPNTLLMSMLAEEIRQRHVHDLSSVSETTRRRMAQIYAAVNPTLPEDPAAAHYVQLMATAGVQPLIADTRRILAEIVRVAQVRKKASDGEAAAGNGVAAAQLNGDQWLEFYVQQAALAARHVRRDNGPRSFLLAIGLALDDQGLIPKLSLATEALARMEGEQERQVRLVAIGQPTMRGRADLARNFFISAQLIALAGSPTGRSPETLKTIAQLQDGAEFDFDDIAANRAGIVFAHAVLSGRLSLDDVAQRFTCEAVLPPLEELRTGVNAQQFEGDLRAIEAGQLNAALSNLEARLTTLPIYQAPDARTR